MPACAHFHRSLYSIAAMRSSLLPTAPLSVLQCNSQPATSSPRGLLKAALPAVLNPQTKRNPRPQKGRRRTRLMSASDARKLFGTDGIRAVAGQAPLDPTTIYATGLAIAHSLKPISAQPRVILGRDTRESSPWIAATLAAGLREAGAKVESAGVVPTPAIAFLTQTHGFHAGVVISASHNPWQDNGIKLFGSNGYKLPDTVELAIEYEILHHASQINAPVPATMPPVEDNASYRFDYIQFLIDTVPGLSLDGLNIVADCANGAAAAVAPELFRRLNAGNEGQVTLLNIAPDGRNINDNCGALHPKNVAAETQK